MPNPIPEERRRQVYERSRGRCERCGGSGSQWHHRRGRSVGGEHQHCAANGALLCVTCHTYVHAHPAEAREVGLIVSRNAADPSLLPIRRYDGWWTLECDGQMSPVGPPSPETIATR